MDVNLIIAGVSTSLSDGALCWLDAWDGLGLNDPEDLFSQGPQQRGDTDEGYQFPPRIFSLVFKVTRESEGALDTARETLLRLLKPSKTVAKTFEFTLENGVVRYLEAKMVSTQISDRRGRRHQKIGGTFKANDPDFYGETEAATFGQSGGSSGFTVPMPVPHEVGTSTLDETLNITYGGTAPTFPVLRITGPITDAVIENLTTGEAISFAGLTIDAGDYCDIDLRYGYKQVLDQDGAYVVVSDDSDLATFHLAPAPEAAGGLNVLKISGTSVTGDTRVDASWVEKFESL